MTNFSTAFFWAPEVPLPELEVNRDRKNGPSLWLAKGLGNARELHLSSIAQPDRQLGARFRNPRLDLLSLLKGAAEIEHALLVQYLYAYFSINGEAFPKLGVAFYRLFRSEMSHFRLVNELLVQLGSEPAMTRTDFPFQSTVYPFEFCLESMSQHSVAKYCYAEAPAFPLDGGSDETQHFLRLLKAELRVDRPQQLDSLYTHIIKVANAANDANLIAEDMAQYIVASAETIRDEGVKDHFDLLRKVLISDKQLFGDYKTDPWLQPVDDPNFPSFVLRANPSLVSTAEYYRDDLSRALATLFNLNYWLVLALLDLYFRMGADPVAKEVSQRFGLERDGLRARAVEHMRVSMTSVAQALVRRGYGAPFDQLPGGYSFSSNIEEKLRLTLSLAEELQSVEEDVVTTLEPDVSANLQRTSTALVRLLSGALKHHATTGPKPSTDGENE